MTAKTTRSRGWCFTHNNPKQFDAKYIYHLYKSHADIKYVIVGLEEGKNGTPHFQGYIYFVDAKSFKKVKELLFDDCHIEPQKAKANVKAYCYCMEDDNYIEYGERPRQGNRTDLEVIKHDIIDGKDDRYLYQNYFSQMCQYSRQIRDARHHLMRFKDVHLILYDSETISNVYDEVSDKRYVNPLVIQSYAEIDCDRLSHIYYSRGHDAIYYPQCLMIAQHPIGMEIERCLYDNDI